MPLRERTREKDREYRIARQRGQSGMARRTGRAKTTRRSRLIANDEPPPFCHETGMLNGMTDPSQYGTGESPQPTPPPGYPFPPPPQGVYPPGAYADPAAPYGRHPLTGEPLSDKSKVVGGLLQLLGLLGIVGIGRIYLGYVGLGVAQLIVGVVTCGIGAIVWGIVDAVLILTDKVRDPQGRPLRDGT
jgi:TM2 domain-containing membrane protein YozV